MLDRPGSVTVVAYLLLLVDAITLAAALWFGIAPDEIGTKVFAVVCALGIAAVIWRFRGGRGSARLFLMVFAGFLILNALMGARVEHGTYLYMIGLAALGVFLLFYLNRPDIRAWFRSQNEAGTKTAVGGSK